MGRARIIADLFGFSTDSGVVTFGTDKEITLTHDPDDGLILKHAATADDSFPELTLQTGDTDIAANDKLGQINFQAPDEGTGTDAILVAASISAISEGDFSSSSNATKLSFATGASELAAEKMSLSSGGNLVVSGDVSVGGDLDITGSVDFSDANLTNVGSIQLDSIAGDADANTSITFSGSDVITIATGGTTAVTIDASQNTTLAGTLTAITSIGIGSAVLTEAELEFLDGITAGAGAASKALVLDSSADVASGLRNLTASGTLQGVTITATTAFVPDASDGAALGTTALEFSDLFLADGAVISLGDDDDVTLTHVADTGILLNSTNKLQFNDASQFIHAPSATVLDIAATDEIELTATLIDVVGNLAISGDLNLAGDLEVGGSSSVTVSASGAVVPDANDGATLGTAALGFADIFLADGAIINLGNDEEIKITHIPDTGILLNTTSVIQFRDSAINIGSPADGDLDINADDEIELNSTLIDINGNVEISGTTAQVGVSTSTAKDIFNAGMSVKNGATSAGFVEFFEDSDNGTNKLTLIGPASSADITVTLPSSAGTVALTTDISDEATALAIALG